MSKSDKLLQRIRNNPRQVSFEDLDKLLRDLGFERRQPRGGSSHYTYFRVGMPPLTVPYRRPHVKETYVKSVLELLDALDEL